MKGLVIFLALIAASAALRSGLRKKFGPTIFPGKDYFLDIPRTKTAAISKDYELVNSPEGSLVSVELYCQQSDRTVCLYIDVDTGIVVGLLISILQKLFKPTYDVGTQGFLEWVPVEDSDKYWSKPVYFVDQEYMAKSPEERAASYDFSKYLPLDSLWLTGFHGQLDRVPATEAGLKNDAKFTLQNCLPLMGTHYFYNMSSTLVCKSETKYTFFLLVDSDKVIGFGMIWYGDVAEEHTMCERPGETAIRFIANRGPECLYKQGDKVITLHIYFTDEPTHISC